MFIKLKIKVLFFNKKSKEFNFYPNFLYNSAKISVVGMAA